MTDKRDQRRDYETTRKCGKTDRTHPKECSVRTELRMVASEKCEMDSKC